RVLSPADPSAGGEHRAAMAGRGYARRAGHVISRPLRHSHRRGGTMEPETKATMSFEQAAILILLVGMLIVFALDRIRMELVAVGGLGLGVALGLVGPTEAFIGFSNPAFITVVEILLIVQVLGRSGILDPLARRISGTASTEIGVVAVLCSV